jgi:hypothetical protein
MFDLQLPLSASSEFHSSSVVEHTPFAWMLRVKSGSTTPLNRPRVTSGLGARRAIIPMAKMFSLRSTGVQSASGGGYCGLDNYITLCLRHR